MENKALFISEYTQLIKNKKYNKFIKNLEKQSQTRRKTVFSKYTSIENWHLIENQVYNEKNAYVEIMSIALDSIDKLKEIKLPWTKYLIKELEDRIKNWQAIIENTVWGLNNWLTMSVYTETDIIIRWANVMEDIVTYYDKELEKYKKTAKEDNVMDTIEES